MACVSIAVKFKSVSSTHAIPVTLKQTTLTPRRGIKEMNTRTVIVLDAGTSEEPTSRL